LKIKKATRLYETWLAAQTSVYPPHFDLKHDLMRKEFFAFLRATFYRWVQIWPEVCRELTAAPKVHLDHLMVPSRDKAAAVKLLAELLGVP